MAASGNQEAFGSLYVRYLEPIYRYVFYRVPNSGDAEDLTEQIFLNAWESLTTGKSRKPIENVRAWLYRIARNVVIDRIRKKKPLLVDMNEYDYLATSNEGTPEAELETQLETADLLAALDKLDEPSRELIILRYLNNLGHAEAAEVLGLSEGHSRVLQYRALKKLRKILNE
jgi:RNA polymerase sigma-70 factor (ECF subfamily)